MDWHQCRGDAPLASHLGALDIAYWGVLGVQEVQGGQHLGAQQEAQQEAQLEGQLEVLLEGQLEGQLEDLLGDLFGGQWWEPVGLEVLDQFPGWDLVLSGDPGPWQ